MERRQTCRQQNVRACHVYAVVLGPVIEPPDDLAASLAGEVEHRALCDTLPEPRRIRPDTARQVARDKRLARPRGSDQSRNGVPDDVVVHDRGKRSEEHTSELPSLMRISYAVFCLQKKKIQALKGKQHILK